jgi:hypothetical protein
MVPSLNAADPRIVHYHEGLDTGQRDPAQDGGGSKRPSYLGGTMGLRRTIYAHRRVGSTGDSG